MDNVSVKSVIQEISNNLKQKSSSRKDEISVMQAMLNDKDYVVDVYNSSGKIGEYSPSADARSMISTVIKSTTKINLDEATKLADEHTFSKQEAESMVRVSKEFVNTYVDTGRKLPLGSREDSDVSLSRKIVKESTKTYPKKVGDDKDGSPIYDHPTIKVPEYKSMRVYGSCPKYMKEEI